MIDLSITIVAYRDYSDVMAAIESIELHTDKKIQKQIYIVDNSCFEEECEDKIQFCLFLKKYLDVTYIDVQENLGFGKGHNRVLPSLDSKYHAIVNPDIILQEDSFSKLISFFETKTNGEKPLGMIVPKLVDERGQMIKAYRTELTRFDMFIRYFCPGLFKKRKAWHTMDAQDYTKPFEVPFAQGSFLLIDTALFKELEGFDDRFFMYMEDADLCKRVNEKHCVMYCPSTSVIHKWEKGSHKSMALFRIHVRSMRAYFKKWR